MRHALRNLIGRPALVTTVVGTLTIALAFAIASASMVSGLLLRPYPKLGQLVLVRDAKPREGAHQRQAIAIGDFLDARRNATAFSALTAWRPQPLVVTSAGAEPERVQAIAVTANFFATLAVTPIAGRSFDADADTPGREGVTLVSRRLWHSRFAADPSLVGREIGLNGRATTVIGIVGDDDYYPPGVDAWIPLVFTPSEAGERATQTVAAIGRLADTSSAAAATGQLATLAGMLAERYPLTNRGRGFELLPLRQEQYEFTAPLFLFVLAAAALVLLLAVVNVGNLLVARTLDRRRELALRAMLGANAGQVAAVPIVELLMLIPMATACGIVAAGGVVNAVRVSLPGGIARWFAGWSSLRVDATAAIAGCGVAVLVALALASIVGLASRRAALESGAPARLTRRTTWGRRILVGGEVSLAAVLLLGGTVMVAGFNRIAAAFERLAPSQLLKFTLTLPESRYPDALRIATFHSALLERLRTLPEVERAALIRNEPASNVPNPIVAFHRDDAPALPPSDRPRIDVEVVSPALFDTLRVDVLVGRPLIDGDGPDAARVAVISETAVRRFWPDRNPVGTTIRLGTDVEPIRIVGIATDFTLNWYDPEPRPILFLADAQFPARTTSVLVRTRGDPMSLARPIRAAIAQLDDRQPLTELESLSTTIADSLSPVRIIQRLLMVGALVATALAALGIFGVLAQWVGARRREFGVRFALGATRATIVRLVLQEAVLTAAAGTLVGLALASAVVRLAGGALLGVPSLDVRAVLVVTACTIALTIAGVLEPARRAARVDVAELLRMD